MRPEGVRSWRKGIRRVLRREKRGRRTTHRAVPNPRRAWHLPTTTEET